ncbi:hypothetical protein PVAP13_5NG170980 [Panicum virgatum]|uniref:Uncharacterized protein n=1 Tax=Panicum virgatum TaxID=38727 RepID=A0A8T0S365_PANVG|nr:hypothetical protein PVAP13_5NG170980 [Panicum virgatum]
MDGISGTRPCRPCYPRSCIRPGAPSSHDLVSRACPFWGRAATPVDPRSRQPPLVSRRRRLAVAASGGLQRWPRAVHRARAGTVFSFFCLSPWMQRTSPIMEAGPGSCSSTVTAACWWSRGEERRARRAEVTWPLPRNAPRP